ncbi:MAG: amino acid adenylation domain-containing protein [Bacteroidales bacterium]|nr:amino acid adenylation domain-containing protein [Bacteroidales bacterium]
MTNLSKENTTLNKKREENNYWKTLLSGITLPTYIPVDSTVIRGEGDYKEFSINLDDESSSFILKISNNSNVRLHIILVSLVKVLLYKYRTQSELLSITTIDKQVSDKKILNHILPFKTFVAKDQSFKEVILAVKESLKQASDNQNYPIEKLAKSIERQLQFEKPYGLFNIAILLDGMHDEKYLEGIDCHLLFKFRKINDKINLVIKYKDELYTKNKIERVAGHLKNIANSISNNIELQVNSINYLSENESKNLLEGLNENIEQPIPESIYQVIKENAKKYAHKVALVYKDEHITYQVLDKKANSIAKILKIKGVVQNSIVGVLGNRSMNTMLNILGTLKAGGTYLPIDPEYPLDRIKFMIEDANIKYLLVDPEVYSKIEISGLFEELEDSTELIHTQCRSQIEDFNSLPFPDRSKVDYDKYNKHIGQAMVKNSIAIQATRGCPYACAYCHKIWPKKHVWRSSDNIFEEIQMYYNQGIKRFVFIDDIFNLKKNNSKDLFKKIIDKGLKIQLFFPNGLRGDILNEELIDLMVEAGMVNVALALETASPRLQKLIGKNLNLDKLRTNINYICEKHPHVVLELFTMHGFPTETEEEANSTLEFIKSIKWLHFPYVHILKIYPNTDMSKLAIENGISSLDIDNSANLSYHELPTTLPFEKSFTLKYQSDFFNNYFLSKERLIKVLPHQMKVLTEDEIVQKYNSYLPVNITNIEELLEFLKISKEELGAFEFVQEDEFHVKDLNKKLQACFKKDYEVEKNAFKILLLDLSQNLTSDEEMLYDVVEPPLGLMYLAAYVEGKFRQDVDVRVLKSKIDFDNFSALKNILDDFKPDVIGVRTLSYYKEFFHETISNIRLWNPSIPILAGGPYPSSDYMSTLKDGNIDLVIQGEGEFTFGEIVECMMKNDNKLPDEEQLKTIDGIHFMKKSVLKRQIISTDFKNINSEPEELAHINKPDDGAYIIYTSGTTGRPKGVMVSHENVLSLLINNNHLFDFNKEDIWSVFHSLCFDFSVWEIFGSLFFGGKAILIPTDITKDPDCFRDVLQKEKVTILNQTPSSFYNVINKELQSENKSLKLRSIIFGGEALNPSKLSKWRNSYPNVKLVNMFGITETTVHVTYKEITQKEIEEGISNIGKSLPTSLTLVLNENMELLPIGMPGELYVGGSGVSLGYLNRTELNFDKFINKNNDYKTQVYKTGDKVVLNEKYELEYIGRIDEQIQLRGFRIELKEIESEMNNHDKIDNAYVELFEKDEEKYLSAYYVSNEELENAEIRKFLQKRLPYYMLPSYYIRIDNIPLTINGKIDKKLLPKPSVLNCLFEVVAPENELQVHLVEIWKKVLQVNNIGIEDSFFNLGGDSIKGIRLVNAINENLDTRLRVADLFKNDTIRTLSLIVKNKEADQENNKETQLLKDFEQIKESAFQKNIYNQHEIEDLYPMSDIQRGMVYHAIKSADKAVYHDQMIHQIKIPDFKQNTLKDALKLMSQKHSILRASFNMENFEESSIVIFKEIEIDYQHEDISEMPKDSKVEFLGKYLEDDKKKILRTDQKGLWRLRTFQVDENEIFVLFVCHHAIIDGWSDASFITELHNLYFKLLEDINYVPVKLKSTYKDYVIDQTIERSNNENINFWKTELSGVKKYDDRYFLNKPQITKNEFKFSINELDSDLVSKINKKGKDLNISLKSIYLTAFSFALNMFSFEPDFVFGLVSNSRIAKPDGDKILGCFLNTLPLKIKFSLEQENQDLMTYFNTKLNDLKKYDSISLFEILKFADHEGAENALFDIIFNYVDFHILNQIDYTQEQKSGIPYLVSKLTGNARADTPLNFTLDTTKESVKFYSSFDSSKYSEEKVKQIHIYLVRALEILSGDDSASLSKSQLIDKNEKQEILNTLNNTDTSYPKDKTIHQLFEEQAERSPDNIALVLGSESITYSELNKKSNQLAQYLIHNGALESDFIGIINEPAIEVYISILAILKTGKAYLPIDNSLPDSRIQFMLNDCGVKILLASNLKTQYLDNDKNPIVPINIFETLIGGSSNLNLKTSSTSPAYVIYTSGSTGKPKGVLIEHKSLVNLSFNHNKFYGIKSDDRLSKFAGFGFDASVWEIFPSFIAGSSLYIIDENIKPDPGKVNKYFEKNNITVSFLPTQFCEKFMEYDNKSLKILLTGGDKLNYFKKRDYKLYNNYGPTENTVVTSRFEVQNLENNIPIGKPIENIQVYILDRYSQVQAFGVPGELCISGIGLAKGYIGNDELSAEKFTKHPFNKGERIYRTGDLACCLPDGNIEFLGRIDQQVKIRGFRIELGEIESVLLKHEYVQESVVLTREETGDKHLCAYIVCKEGYIQENLRQYLSTLLPDYMVPAYFVDLEALPISPSGKVNRKALQALEIEAGADYIAPSNAIEEKLLDIWSEILNTPVEKISVMANFFLIGGHSLKATVLASYIHKEIGVEFPLEDIFLHTSIRAQACQIRISKKTEFVSIPKTEEQSNYPVSPAQKRLYFLQQFDLESIAYNMPNVFSLGKEADKRKIEEVFKQLIDRHESFRTSIIVVDGEPVQFISKEVEFELEELSITNNEVENTRNKFIKPFDLSNAPYLRVALVNIKGEDSLLMIDMHHIISDGTSHIILEKEFQTLYSEKELTPLKLQYKDYSQWQNSNEQQEFIKDQEQYWLTKFEGEIPVLSLPMDYVRPLMQSQEGATVNFILSKEETEGIRLFSKENDLTLYMSLLSVFSILLSKLSGQDDIVVGTPIASRNHADLENIVGMFVNTLSIRNAVKGEETIRDFVSSLKQTVLGAYENQNYQFEDLVGKISVERDTGRNPIFDVMFNLLNQAEYNGSINEDIDNSHKKGTSKFDLNLTAIEFENNISLSIEYSTRLFKEETLDRFINYFKQIVAQLTRKSELKISAIDILTEDEKHQVLYEFNNTKADYPTDKTIHQLFEDQVEKTPENIALSLNGETVKYSELNAKVNQLAWKLREQGVKNDSVVGLFVERSIEMVVGILGILKSGGAYLPIDTEYPKDRISYMFEDSKLQILLVNTDISNLNLETEQYLIYDLRDESSYASNTSNPDVIGTPEDLVYIIYTSGSTGKPKGVMLKDKNMVNLIQFDYDKTNLDFSSILQFSTISFDASAHEIFGALLSGGKLVLVDESTRLNVMGIFELMTKEQVKTVFWPMSLIKLIFGDQTFVDQIPKCLRHLQTAGEKVIINESLRNYLKTNNVFIHNHYGPSETHVVTTLTIAPNEDHPEFPTIGKPISNTTAYILDKSLNLVPVGVKGELYFGGTQVGRGYFGKEELTREKFIESPFIKGEKIYQTGDIARWLPDGNIDFLGRVDHQVKIRGFRVELGEIESALLKYENIKEIVVLAREEKGDKYLCAYIVSTEEIDHEELRAYMSERLPDYMVPSYFVVLESFPQTANGKINSKALPKPEIKEGDDHVAPSAEIEEKVVEIWSEVLDIDKENISVNSDFFSLGGHSLKAIALLSKIEKEFSVRIAMKDFFANPSVKKLGKSILKSKKTTNNTKLVPVESKEYYVASMPQKRLYFIQNLNPADKSYNVSAAFTIKGELDKQKFENALQQLINRHAGLRTSFIMLNDEIVQKINNKLEPRLTYINEDDKDIPQIIKDFITPFELSEKSLFRVGLVKTKKNDSILILDMHHIISDEVSNRIIFGDFVDFYNGKKLSLLKIQYVDLCEEQEEMKKRDVLNTQKVFWENYYDNYNNDSSLPYDLNKDDQLKNKGNIISFTLDGSMNQDLIKIREEYNSSIYIIILSVFNILLSKILNHDDIVVGSPITGRENPALKNIVGYLVNTLAMRSIVNGEAKFVDFLKIVNDRTLDAIDNSNYDTIELINKINKSGRNKGKSLFDIMYTYNIVESNKASLSNINVEPYTFDGFSSQCDIKLRVMDNKNSLSLAFEYNENLFLEDKIHRYIKYFKKILNDIILNPEITIDEINLTSEKDEVKLMNSLVEDLE